MDVSKLPEGPVSLVYATPSHQYPMGATLALSRRMRLLDWAWRSGAYIIEDDYDSDFRYNAAPLTALKGLDHHGCTIYLGTFSKSLGAGIRIGYLAVPRELAEPAARIKALLDNGNPWLEQATLAEFIASGGFDGHLRRIRQTYMDRRDTLVESLRRHFGDVDLRGLDGGMHLVWRLPPDFPTAAQVEELARQHGVGAYAFANGGAWAFDRGDDAERVLMFGYSSLSESQIRAGVRRLAAALEGASDKRKRHFEAGPFPQREGT
jgi:GntR family transcriptional regulator/MocR family aminotransferase